jgi:hypothetical protein
MARKWLGHARLATTSIYTNAMGLRSKDCGEDVGVMIVHDKTCVLEPKPYKPQSLRMPPQIRSKSPYTDE